MNRADLIVKAMAAGAAASLEPNILGVTPRQTPVMDAYNELKAAVAEEQPSVATDLLDIAPASEGRQEMIQQQLQASDSPISDNLIRRARHVLELCSTDSPESLLAAGLKAQALSLLEWPSPSSDRPLTDHKEQSVQFNTGANVFTADGDHVGDITRVVMNPVSKEITHIVVEKGFLFTEDKVVPVDHVAAATRDGVTLRPIAGDDELDAFPAYEETHFVPTERVDTLPAEPAYSAHTMYWYPPVGYSSMYGVNSAFPNYPLSNFVQAEARNIPEGTVALQEGASIIDQNGEHVGDLERVYTDSTSGRATHLLISDGFLLKEHRLVPANWINYVMEDKVHLSVDAEFVNELPEHEPDQ